MSRQKFWRQIRLPRKAEEANLPDKTYGQELSKTTERELRPVMNILLLPLDERPVNARYPALLAAAAPDVHVRVPPADMLSAAKKPADCARLAAWLEREAHDADAVIVSMQMLGYGSLIASRISNDGVEESLRRIGALRRLRRTHPHVRIFGFDLLMRISNFDGNVEEPEYWLHHGRQLFALSQQIDRALSGAPIDDDAAQLAALVPHAVRADFVRRRLRNHTVNAAVLHLLADDVLDALVLSSDDTSTFGLPTREKRWLAEWADRLNLPANRLLMYPGADEVGCALLARAVNEARGRTPRFEVRFFPANGAEITAAYEDGPVRLTVERQARAVGGSIVPDDGDFWVGVNAPTPHRREFEPDQAARDAAERTDDLRALAAEATRRAAAGQRVVIADVAYPNGADPALMSALRAAGFDWTAAAAFGAWNTAGNTIGTALAQAVLCDQRTPAQQRFLLHRYVEDWGYQRIVRAAIRARYAPSGEPSPAEQPAACAEIERRLNEFIDSLPGFAGRWRITPGSVRLPWSRTFEVDFDLTDEGSLRPALS